MEDKLHLCEITDESKMNVQQFYETMLHIDELNNLTLAETLVRICDAGIKITKSEIGYIFFYNEETGIRNNVESRLEKGKTL